MQKLLSDPGSLATLIGVILAGVISLITTITIQFWMEKRKKLQVMYSKNIETPSILAESNINKKLQIAYQGKNVTDLKLFKVVITNSGKDQITDLQFICKFDQNVQSLDPSFPEILTTAPKAIQPDQPSLDQVNNTSNNFQYTTKNFVAGQKITANFLFANCKNNTFEVKFLHPQYGIHEYTASSSSSLDQNIIIFIKNIFIFFVLSQISPLIASVSSFFVAAIITLSSVLFAQPNSYNFLDLINTSSVVYVPLGEIIGVLIGLPYLLRAYRAALPLLPLLAQKLQNFF